MSFYLRMQNTCTYPSRLRINFVLLFKKSIFAKSADIQNKYRICKYNLYTVAMKQKINSYDNSIRVLIYSSIA